MMAALLVAACALLLIEMQQRVERAALLIGGGELVVLELEPDVGPGNFRQCLRTQHRRAHHRAFDPCRGSADIVEGEEVGGLGCGPHGRCLCHPSPLRRAATGRNRRKGLPQPSFALSRTIEFETGPQ